MFMGGLHCKALRAFAEVPGAVGRGGHQWLAQQLDGDRRLAPLAQENTPK